jgi:hypothetical protein
MRSEETFTAEREDETSMDGGLCRLALPGEELDELEAPDEDVLPSRVVEQGRARGQR